MKLLWTMLLSGALAQAQTESWELAPVHYSESVANDAMARIAAQLERGEIEIKGESPLEKLEFVLDQLKVPQSSQILVFSKTSKQNDKIGPRNPRSLYFSDDVYVGYVPGGQIEVIAEDPVLGPVFHTIDLAGESGFEVVRETGSCLSCHGNARTENVPGLFARSVFPDAEGRPLLELGTTTVTDATPIEQRWGGYYVSGDGALPHLGNRTYEVGKSLEPKIQSLEDLSGLIDTSKYPAQTSDIVALVVLEHQCRTHNLMTAASMQYRRAHFLAKVIDPEGDPDDGQAGRIADEMAEGIVDALLFKNEVDLGDGLVGDPTFQRDFEAAHPRTRVGRSLAEFRLYKRIFQYPCSYMVYSDAFGHLPARVKSAVLERLRSALSAENESIAPEISRSQKQKVREILEETLPGW